MRLALSQVSMGRYAVELLKEDERTTMGLWLTAGAETINNAGRIIRCGPPYRSAIDDEDDSPFGPQYQIGDIVVFGKYNGSEITLGKREDPTKAKFIIIAESDILCTLVDLDHQGAEYDDLSI